MQPNTDKFAKPFIKVRSLQDVMASELREKPEATNAELAETLWPWLLEQDTPTQQEVFAYAISHMRSTVEKKLRPSRKPYNKKATGELAAMLLQQYNAKKMMEFTYELLGSVLVIGPKLQAKMKPGQKVKDVWTERQIISMLRSK